MTLNRRLPVPARAPPQSTVRTAGFEPAISCSRSTRNTRLSYVLFIKSAQRELNPHFRHGKAVGCRYIMGALYRVPNCQRTRAPGGTRTRVAALRVRYPCRWTTSAFLSVGPEGLEPSPGGLRVRCAAANTLIPVIVQSARRESNPRPDPYKRSALTAELRAERVGPEGLEPTPAGLKVRCAAVTPRPCAWSGVCVSNVSTSLRSSSLNRAKW